MENNIALKHVINPDNFTIQLNYDSTLKHWHDIDALLFDASGNYHEWDENIGSIYFTYDYVVTRYPWVKPYLIAGGLQECVFTVGYECFCARNPVTDIEVR